MFIYCITNLVNDKKYIGQTINKPLTRWNSHKSDSELNSDTHLHRSMRKNGVKQFQFEVIDGSASNIDELNDLEEFYIGFYDTYKGDGYNCTSGGDNFIMSDETKAKMSESHHDVTGKNNSMYGKKHTEESKNRMSNKAKLRESNGFYGRTHTEETKNNHSEKMIGYYKNNKHPCVNKECLQETRNKISNSHKKKVQQLEKNGDFVKEFISVIDAANELQIKVDGIYKCLIHKSKTSAGFIWKYV